MEIPVQDQYKSLFEEFKKLTTVEEKLHFWNSGKLPVNFIQYQEGVNDELYNALQPFAFENDVPQEEWEGLHQWMLDNYYSLSKHPQKHFNLLGLQELKDDFELRLKETSNKRAFTLDEQFKIDSSFQLVNNGGGRGFIRSGMGGSYYRNNKFVADHQSYIEYKDYERLPDYSRFKPYLTTTKKITNGVTLAKYRKYLDEVLKRLEVEASKPKREVTLDHRLLMLHYLGALEKIRKADNATKQGVFLEYLTPHTSEALRQRFSNINNLFPPVEKTRKKKLKEDLQQVLEIFKELGLQSVVKNIQADLRKLDQ